MVMMMSTLVATTSTIAYSNGQISAVVWSPPPLDKPVYSSIHPAEIPGIIIEPTVPASPADNKPVGVPSGFATKTRKDESPQQTRGSSSYLPPSSGGFPLSGQTVSFTSSEGDVFSELSVRGGYERRAEGSEATGPPKTTIANRGKLLPSRPRPIPGNLTLACDAMCRSDIRPLPQPTYGKLTIHGLLYEGQTCGCTHVSPLEQSARRKPVRRNTPHSAETENELCESICDFSVSEFEGDMPWLFYPPGNDMGEDGTIVRCSECDLGGGGGGADKRFGLRYKWVLLDKLVDHGEHYDKDTKDWIQDWEGSVPATVTEVEHDPDTLVPGLETAEEAGAGISAEEEEDFDADDDEHDED